MTIRAVAVAGVAGVLALCGATWPGSATAQTPQGIELLGAAAGHQLWDDESSIGTSWTTGGGVGLTLTESLSIRGRLMRARNTRDFGDGVVFSARLYRYTAELLWRPFTATRAPYFGIGAGGIWYERESRFPGQPPRGGLPATPGETFRRTGTDGILGGLAGFSAVAAERFRLRPEASLWLSRPNNFIVVEFGVVASWAF